MANFTNRRDLENMITPARVVQFYDDDGDGKVDGTDAETLAALVAEADDITTQALYLHGFTADQLNGLSRDRAIRRAATQILAELSGVRRTEFINPTSGEGPFDVLGKRGRDYLDKLSAGHYRSRLEEQHGKNPSTGGQDSIPDPPFIFSRNPNDPNDRFGPGGF